MWSKVYRLSTEKYQDQTTNLQIKSPQGFPLHYHNYSVRLWMDWIQGLKGAMSRYFSIFLESQKSVLYQLNPKNNGLVLSLKILLGHWNCFLSSVATDGKDGNGLKLEKIGPMFSGVDAMFSNITKKYYG